MQQTLNSPHGSRERLAGIGSDPRLIVDIEQCAKKLPGVSSRYKIDREKFSGKQTRRNGAYTFLAAAVEEVRRCARYALNRDKNRLKEYASEYFRKSARSGKKKRKEDEG
ncbi:MAG: hypothetical protein JW913_11935 [Chitinispirillaceae bacterium]|nr:hypothetical protein [Chitinispirillaceae bacterium]